MFPFFNSIKLDQFYLLTVTPGDPGCPRCPGCPSSPCESNVKQSAVLWHRYRVRMYYRDTHIQTNGSFVPLFSRLPNTTL